MSERGALIALLFTLTSLAGPALAEPVRAEPVRAEPAVSLLDLPFRARALRGPGSAVAVAVATSGVLPLARPRGAAAEAPEPGAGIVVVWGDAGGAVLGLADGTVVTTLLGAETLEGLSAAETPRGALPGSRGASRDGISAYLAGPVPDPAGGPVQARDLVVRERQPVGMGGDPKPVPIAATTLSPAPDSAFAPRRPHILTVDGRPAILAVTVVASGGGALALYSQGKPDRGWSVLARGEPQPVPPGGQPIKPAALADFAGTGAPQIAAVAEPDGAGRLQLWTYAGGALRLSHEAKGYTTVSPGENEADLAALIEPTRPGPPELAVPSLDRGAVAFLAFKDGIRERARVSLPAPAAFGLASLGRGEGARLLVGLSDGRIAVVTP